MDQLRWRRVGELFAAARQLDGERRIAFLQENCGQDHELYQQVKSLLDIDGQPGLLDSRPTAPTLGIPHVIAGRFRIIRYIAEGGMGTVYEAEDLQLHDRVALKTIRPDIASNPQAVERFKQEIRLGKRVTHPNVCRIHDLGTDRSENGTEFLFLTMQFLSGESLSSRIRRGPVPQREALPLIEDLADALSAAHQAGVIHRDFKSGNVILVPGSQRACAVVTDFGLARGISDSASLTRSGLVGTVDYMAPEQIIGGEITAATDIYALGVVMYEMVTGQLPFTHDSKGTVIQKHLHDEPQPPRALAPHLEPNLEEAILGCLKKLPGERFQSAAEVKEALVHGGRKPDGERRRWAVAANAGKKAHGGPFRSRISAIMAAIFGVASPTSPETVSAKKPDALAEPFEGSSREPPSTPPTHETTRLLRPPSPTILVSDAAAAESQPPEPSGSVTGVYLPRFAEPGPIEAQLEFSLTLTQSGDRLLVGRTIRVTSVPFHIGRFNPDLNISSDDGISREHAVIEHDRGAFTLTDLHSVNGTYLNGRRIRAGTPETLPFGAIIRLGNSTAMTFSSEQFAELPDLTGQVIGDRFRLSRVIRNGSKTALYEASDSQLPRTVAVKILSPKLASYSGYLEQFKREAETAARLQHPRICKVIACGTSQIRASVSGSSTAHYLAMELMAGDNLSGHTSRENLLPLNKIVTCLDEVTQALDYAHRNGVVHNGIKLSSVVIDDEGCAYVTDFGEASLK